LHGKRREGRDEDATTCYSSGEFEVTSGRINLSTDHPIAGYCLLPVYSVRVFCGSFEPSIFRVLRQPSADECRGVDYSRHFLFRARTMARSPRLANRPIIMRLECSVMTRDRGKIIKSRRCNLVVPADWGWGRSIKPIPRPYFLSLEPRRKKRRITPPPSSPHRNASSHEPVAARIE
jgi:hypothetical protein